MPPTGVCDFASFGRATPRSTAGPGAGGRLFSPRRWRRRGPGAREPWKSLCTPNRPRLTTAPTAHALAAQPPTERDLLLARAGALGPLRLDHAGQALEARLGEEDAAAPPPELALSDVGMPVAVGAQRRLRVVEMQRAQAPLADDLQAIVQHRGEPLFGADVEPRCEEVTRVQAHAQALGSARGVDDLGQLVERAAEGPAGPGGVLEVQRAAVALAKRLRDDLARALDRGGDLAGLRAARVQHHGMGAERVAGLQRCDQRRARLVAELLLVAGRVEQVDRVDEQRVDPAALHSLAEGRHLLVGVDRRLPGARVLVEDLDRVAALLDAAFDGLGGTAGRGDVGADQHVLPSIAPRRCAGARGGYLIASPSTPYQEGPHAQNPDRGDAGHAARRGLRRRRVRGVARLVEALRRLVERRAIHRPDPHDHADDPGVGGL